MTPNPYNEDHLVEQPALERLNPGQPPQAIGAAIEELSRNRSAMGLVAANQEVYRLLKDGVLVSVPDLERGGQSKMRLRVVDWEQFFEWKRIESEIEARRVSLEVLLRGTCQPKRCLDQFIGVNNAIAATLEARRRGHGRASVFWKTQGSGKNNSMAFYSQKIQRKLPDDWTFVIVTNRTDLDEQIAGTFKAAGVVSQAEGDQCHIEQAYPERNQNVYSLTNTQTAP
jgi:type I site-specific restriction-modification system R (restriction) subunit